MQYLIYLAIASAGAMFGFLACALFAGPKINHLEYTISAMRKRLEIAEEK